MLRYILPPVCFLFGFGASWLLYKFPQTSKFNVSKGRINWILFIFSFFLLVWNTALLLLLTWWSTKGGDKMSSEIQLIFILGMSFVGLTSILFGFLIGEIIFTAIQSKRNKQKEGKGQKQDVMVSPKELESTIAKIEDYKKAKSNLDDFLNKIQEKPKE